MVILVHTLLVEADTTISGHFLWAEMEIILFISYGHVVRDFESEAKTR